VRTPPEPLLTLEEACQRYFPGKSACALRWMIKRRGYAHSRWGREYRLTPSQVAAIADDLARPATRAPARVPRRPTTRGRARPVTGAVQATAALAAAVPGGGDGPGGRPPASRRVLEERLSAPLSGTGI
jgi:hypothetical protein